MISGNQPRFLFSEPDFQVLGFSGSEGINALYRFQLELVSKNTALDFDALVGKPAQLVIIGAGQTVRYINSLIARLDLVSTLPQRAIFQAQLVPPHYRLTLKRQLRAFQDLTTQQIVTQVLAEAGITKLDWRLRENYKPRNYCAQYRESDLAFLARLLEEEGISYHFEHSATDLLTVFSDGNEAFLPLEDPASEDQSQAPQVMFSGISSMQEDQEFVSAFRFRQRLQSGKVQLRDYNFKRPRLDLKGEALGPDEALEVYDYPGEFTDAELGSRLARARLEELAQQRETGGGSGNCLRFSPGRRFVLGGRGPRQRHPRQELNQEYLLLQVTHTGHQGGVLEEEGDYSSTVYGNTFSVQPAGVPLRPERTTLRPSSLGTQTATVVGPRGDEVYVDSYGRVKLRFHWDREGKATGWVRVSQAWAGAGFGSQLLPRVGQEVLVSFLEGDPDRPVVIGRVYNGEQVVPYDLPAHKTRSVLRSNSSPANASAQDTSKGLVNDYHANPGFNELSFEDAQDHEELYLQAERDYNAVVENDRATLIKRDRHENVRNIQQLKVGRNQTVQVKESSRLQAATILFEAKEQLSARVGKSLLELTPDSLKLLTTNLLSSAIGMHDVKGVVVKLNAEPPKQTQPVTLLDSSPSSEPEGAPPSVQRWTEGDIKEELKKTKTGAEILAKLPPSTSFVGFDQDPGSKMNAAYDSGNDIIYIPNSYTSQEAAPVAAHEAVHADQYVNRKMTDGDIIAMEIEAKNKGLDVYEELGRPALPYDYESEADFRKRDQAGYNRAVEKQYKKIYGIE